MGHNLEQCQETACDVNGNLWQYSKDVFEDLFISIGSANRNEEDQCLPEERTSQLMRPNHHRRPTCSIKN